MLVNKHKTNFKTQYTPIKLLDVIVLPIHMRHYVCRSRYKKASKLGVTFLFRIIYKLYNMNIKFLYVGTICWQKEPHTA